MPFVTATGRAPTGLSRHWGDHDPGRYDQSGMVAGWESRMEWMLRRVDLSEAERAQLTALLNGGKHAARKIKRSQVLLAADAGVSDDMITSSVSVGGSAVYRTKRRFVRGNLELALSEEARPGTERKTVREGGGATGGDRLLQPARGSQALDARPVGRCDGQANGA
ncbi:MAG: transposase [Rhodopila sp.]|nr:transposase [Rhodopila sp.]